MVVEIQYYKLAKPTNLIFMPTVEKQSLKATIYIPTRPLKLDLA